MKRARPVVLTGVTEARMDAVEELVRDLAVDINWITLRQHEFSVGDPVRVTIRIARHEGSEEPDLTEI